MDLLTARLFYHEITRLSIQIFEFAHFHENTHGRAVTDASPWVFLTKNRVNRH